MRTYLGMARVFRDNGGLVVDTDSIRRNGELSGDDDFGSDYDDDDDFGEDDEDDFGEDDDDEDDDSDEDDDDDSDEDDDEEEFGASRRRKKKSPSKRRKSAGSGVKVPRRAVRTRKSSSGGKTVKKWQNTALSGSKSESSAGAVTVTIVPAHWFRGKDIAFNGSSAGAEVTTIMFGDQLIWNTSDGLDVSAISTNSFIRGLIRGALARPGVPITIHGTIASGGDVLKVGLFGQKPCR